jgi:hypothetical protein
MILDVKAGSAKQTRVKLLRVALFVQTLATVASRPAIADQSTDVGALAAVVAGSHVGYENPNPVSGVVPGAALEFTERVERVRLRLEGIPTVAATGSGSGPYGASSASLSVLNAIVYVDVDPHRFIRLGSGYQLVDLTNKNGNNGDRNDVRIASPIYAVATTVPLRGYRFVEAQLLVDPNLSGNLLVFNALGQSGPNEPERGAEVDYSAAYGWGTPRVAFLAGIRGLVYHTRNTLTGALVDRNTGAGVTFEAHFHLGRR